MIDRKLYFGGNSYPCHYSNHVSFPVHPSDTDNHTTTSYTGSDFCVDLKTTGVASDYCLVLYNSSLTPITWNDLPRIKWPKAMGLFCSEVSNRVCNGN